jgi:hypothetical protein
VISIPAIVAANPPQAAAAGKTPLRLQTTPLAGKEDIAG